MAGAHPKISIVTPSFNQGQFLGKAISSVLDQNYENLEYIVQDGGSTDDSVKVIERFSKGITSWESAPDNGQYDAINRGFAKSTGEIMGWLNSDDTHLSWTLSTVSEIFSLFPEVGWLTTRYPMLWRADGKPASCGFDRDGAERKGFLKGTHCPGLSSHSRGFIQQESTFWRRSLWERVGGNVDSSMKYAADFDLWVRFIKEAPPYFVDLPLSGFRLQPNQKTNQHWDSYCKEAFTSLQKHGGSRMSSLGSALRMVGKVLDRRVSVRLKLLEPIKVIELSDGKDSWKIVNR